MMPTLRSQQHRDITSQGQKRRAASSSDETVGEPYNRPSKKQKANHSDLLPAEFWDGLSKIPLTKNAVRELDRRNRFIRFPSSVQTVHTRRVPPTLSRFARQGGPDLSDLRGCQIPINLHDNMSSSQTSLGRRKRGSQSPVKRASQSPSKTNATPNTTSTRSTGPYDRAFQQNLVDHNILPDGYEYPDGALPPEPENMDDILLVMAQPRPSLSPSRFSNDDFKRYRRADTHAFKERDITTNIIPLIEGTVPDSKCVAGDVAFTNLNDLTDGTIVAGKPDLYYGARPEQLNTKVRKEKSSEIIPSSQSDLPILANFFLEAKGPDGTLSVASRQACYNGALGARGMHSLQSYGQPELEYDNKAYTISSIYHGGTLKMYTSHPIPPRAPDGKPGFVTTQIKTWGLTGDADTFRQGASAFRNARDWAKIQRDNAIQQANQKATGQNIPSLTVGGAGLTLEDEPSGEESIATSQDTILKPDSRMSQTYGSDTSADELSTDLWNFFPAKRTKSRSRSPRKKQ